MSKGLNNANALERITVSFNYKGAAFDLSDMVTALNIHENMDSDLYGSLELTDDAGIIDNVILTGDEIINITFTYFEMKVNLAFFFNGIRNINLGENNNEKTYQIVLRSINDYISASHLVSKSYNGSSIDIIREIYANYFVFTPLAVNTESINTGRYIAPNISPKAAINAVLKNGTDKHSSVMFMTQNVFLHGSTVIDSLHNILEAEPVYTISPQTATMSDVNKGPTKVAIGSPTNIVINDNADIIGTTKTGVKGKIIDYVTLDNSSFDRDIFRGTSKPGVSLLSTSRNNMYGNNVAGIFNSGEDTTLTLAKYKASIVFSINATAYNTPAIPGLRAGDLVSMSVSNYTKTRHNSKKTFSAKYSNHYVVAGIDHHFSDGVYTQNIKLSTGAV